MSRITNIKNEWSYYFLFHAKKQGKKITYGIRHHPGTMINFYFYCSGVVQVLFRYGYNCRKTL